jgi:hypothetical protein
MGRVTLAVGLIVASLSASAADDEFYGTYQLVNASVKYLDTGEIVPDVNGKHPKGFAMYGKDGRFMVMITDDGRPKPESTAKMTDEQRINLFRTMLAYGGTYTLDGNRIDHHVDICWDEVRCGTTVTRDISKDGDKLIYTTHPAPFSANGRMSVVTVVWQKMK